MVDQIITVHSCSKCGEYKKPKDLKFNEDHTALCENCYIDPVIITATERSAIAKKAARTRWKNDNK